MKLRRTLLSISLTAALGLGVWTLAVSFTSASFSDGDILSAADLNAILNNNFDAAATAINELDGAVSGLETDLAALETAVDNKVDRAGGSMTGRLTIRGAATNTGGLDTTTVFRVENTATTGSAAVFESNTSSDHGTVSIKQQGAGPALSLRRTSGGALIAGGMTGMVSFVVEENGSIRIGNMGSSGAGAPTLRIDAQEGTVTNRVGSGLPLGFGYVALNGSQQSGTTNFTSRRDGDVYRIKFDDERYSNTGFVSMVQSTTSSIHRVHTTAQNGELVITFYNSLDQPVSSNFHFVTYKDGN